MDIEQLLNPATSEGPSVMPIRQPLTHPSSSTLQQPKTWCTKGDAGTLPNSAGRTCLRRDLLEASPALEGVYAGAIPTAHSRHHRKPKMPPQMTITHPANAPRSAFGYHATPAAQRTAAVEGYSRFMSECEEWFRAQKTDTNCEVIRPTRLEVEYWIQQVHDATGDPGRRGP